RRLPKAQSNPDKPSRSQDGKDAGLNHHQRPYESLILIPHDEMSRSIRPIQIEYPYVHPYRAAVPELFKRLITSPALPTRAGFSLRWVYVTEYWRGNLLKGRTEKGIRASPAGRRIE